MSKANARPPRACPRLPFHQRYRELLDGRGCVRVIVTGIRESSTNYFVQEKGIKLIDDACLTLERCAEVTLLGTPGQRPDGAVKRTRERARVWIYRLLFVLRQRHIDHPPINITTVVKATCQLGQYMPYPWVKPDLLAASQIEIEHTMTSNDFFFALYPFFSFAPPLFAH